MDATMSQLKMVKVFSKLMARTLTTYTIIRANERSANPLIQVETMRSYQSPGSCQHF